MSENEAESEYPKKGGAGSSTAHGYRVEARFTGEEPRQFGDILLDGRWRALYFKESYIGVPVGRYDMELLRHGLHPYAAAEALRWWFHAEADASRICGGICLETRLVKHKLKIEHEIQVVSDHKIVGGEDRSSSMPDWGLRKPLQATNADQ